jgi:hypothetical protein
MEKKHIKQKKITIILSVILLVNISYYHQQIKSFIILSVIFFILPTDGIQLAFHVMEFDDRLSPSIIPSVTCLIFFKK